MPACPLASQMRAALVYMQSPPKGKHRYIFILYPQHGRVSANPPKSRQNFTPHQFNKVSSAAPSWCLPSATPKGVVF